MKTTLHPPTTVAQISPTGTGWALAFVFDRSAAVPVPLGQVVPAAAATATAAQAASRVTAAGGGGSTGSSSSGNNTIAEQCIPIRDFAAW